MNRSFAEETISSWKSLLWLIVGLALLIRLFGTWYGLPFSYWVDEYHEVMRALELGTGGFNFERTSKGGFYYLLFAEYGIYYVLLKIAGVVSTPQDFAEQFVRDPSALFLIGRVTAALIGALTVVGTFYLTRQAYSTRAALFAALILAVNLLHVDISRRVGVDVPMVLMATLALYFGVKIAAEGRRRDYLLAALCAALAATSKLPGVLVLVPLLIAHTYFIIESDIGMRKWFASPNLWLSAAVFAVVLIATNPGILATTGYLSLFVDQPVELLNETGDDLGMGVAGGERPNLYAYYCLALRASMGWPLFGLALFSVGYAVWKRTPTDVMLLAYALVNYVIISSTTSDKLYYPRYALPIVVALTVLAGRALADLSSRFENQRITKVSIAVALLVAWPVWQSIVTAYSLTQADTRTLAKEWIETHVPTGSHVLIEGLKIGPVKGTVQLELTANAIRQQIEVWKEREPKQAKFLKLQLAVHEGTGYDLEFIRRDSTESLEKYANDGVQYIVIRPAFFIETRGALAAHSRFVAELRADERFKLLKRFEGGSRTRPGPTIEIYGSVAEHGESEAIGPSAE